MIQNGGRSGSRPTDMTWSMHRTDSEEKASKCPAAAYAGPSHARLLLCRDAPLAFSCEGARLVSSIGPEPAFWEKVRYTSLFTIEEERARFVDLISMQVLASTFVGSVGCSHQLLQLTIHQSLRASDPRCGVACGDRAMPLGQNRIRLRHRTAEQY